MHIESGRVHSGKAERQANTCEGSKSTAPSMLYIMQEHAAEHPASPAGLLPLLPGRSRGGGDWGQAR
eukprot:1160136-Pelagomonas_calceolata.AAC.3